MLILTRKCDEEIMIGEGNDAISIVVVRIGPNSVKLGINAPKSLAVHRRESWDAIRNKHITEAQEAAAKEASC